MKASMGKRGSLLNKLVFGNRGSSMIFFAISLVVISASAALVTDIGMVAITKSQLSNAVDAATLAAARSRVERPGTERAVAAFYLEKNGFGGVQFDISIDTVNNILEVNASKDVPYGFGKVLGLDKATVHSRARARVLPVMSVDKGVRPFALPEMTLLPNVLYTLKEGGGSGTTGNYGAIELGGAGASTYLDNIVEGYNARLMVGDKIDTEPGNMSGSTYTGVTSLIDDCPHNPKCTASTFVANCPRLITIVIVDTLAVNGRKTVTIKGFASFFLTGVDGTGHDSIVHGYFVNSVTSGETGSGQTDYGLYGVRLID